MSKKFYQFSMSANTAFYKAATGAGQGIKAAWDVATGSSRMKKQGLEPGYGMQAGTAMICGLLGIFGGEAAALSTHSFMIWPEIIAASALLPTIVAHQAYATFKCGEAQMKKLGNESAGQKRLPPPKPDGLI